MESVECAKDPYLLPQSNSSVCATSSGVYGPESIRTRPHRAPRPTAALKELQNCDKNRWKEEILLRAAAAIAVSRASR